MSLITLFFVLIFILINGLFWIALEHFAREYEVQQHHRLHFVLHDRTLLEHQPNPMFMPPPPPPPPPLSITLKSPALLPIWIVFIAIDLLILAFFAFLLKKLSPLHRLKNAIINFQEGDTQLNVPIEGKDEISQITHEFNHALEKIAAMKESRALFLRNILHELKTPIMKGSLTADCLDTSEDQERLKRIFNRMNYLLGEFSTMERFSSGEWELNLREYRFVDLLDHACDILLCSKENFDIKGEETGLIIKVDFELFAIALKNLLDNALKYSDTKPSILILSHSVEICNLADPLPQENQSFDKPFNRTYESSMTGLGLGLYITHSILKKHGFRLRYHHDSGMNCFRILTI
ncbi:ArsS family sensor histidine kinase [Sulfuricurvum sp.]|uniref:ArsS family sensor histidine kinase n=1 Tax=Sulfuricurvum sp. TaxID=2025608 RepID=UPI002E33243C|nr:ArsS family sensor histidine kinase [Sulfuricurvum sp.]